MSAALAPSHMSRSRNQNSVSVMFPSSHRSSISCPPSSWPRWRANSMVAVLRSRVPSMSKTWRHRAAPASLELLAMGSDPGLVRGITGLLVEDHRLVLQVREQACDAALTADAGLLESTEPDPEVRPVAVLTDGPGTQTPAYLSSPVGIVGENSRVEPEHRVIGDPDRVLLVRRRDDRHHGPEDLLLSDFRGIVDVPEHSWLDKPSPVKIFGP